MARTDVLLHGRTPSRVPRLHALHVLHGQFFQVRPNSAESCQNGIADDFCIDMEISLRPILYVCQISAVPSYDTVPLGRSRLREPGRACRANGPARTVCPQALIVVDCGCRLGRKSFRRTYNPHGGRCQPPLSRDASRESLRNFTGRRTKGQLP